MLHHPREWDEIQWHPWFHVASENTGCLSGCCADSSETKNRWKNLRSKQEQPVCTTTHNGWLLCFPSLKPLHLILSSSYILLLTLGLKKVKTWQRDPLHYNSLPLQVSGTKKTSVTCHHIWRRLEIPSFVSRQWMNWVLSLPESLITMEGMEGLQRLKCMKYTLMVINSFGVLLGFFIVLFGMSYKEQIFPGGYKGKETAIFAGGLHLLLSHWLLWSK